MSSDLVWLCVRNNSSFLLKRNGAQFTTEKNNVSGVNSQRYSGLANKRTVGVEAAENGVVLTSTSTKPSLARKPNAKVKSVLLKKDVKRVAKSVKNACKGYRSDLETKAVARAAALLRAKKNSGIKVSYNRRQRKTVA